MLSNAINNQHISVYCRLFIYSHNASNMLKTDRSIIHVEVKDTHEHFYFGSIRAMFEDSRVKHLLGIKYQTFRTKGLTGDHAFENEYIIVRKGNIQIVNHDNNVNLLNK